MFYVKIEGGSVAEWLKAHDSKSCGQQCLGGSNPLASARIKKTTLVVVFLIFCERMRAQGSSNARSLATTAHCLYPLASARIKKDDPCGRIFNYAPPLRRVLVFISLCK